MLSRAADNLYWMARYNERAENMARILDVSHRMTLITGDADEGRTLWEPALIIAGCDKPFAATRRPVTRDHVIEYLAFDPDNPSSIRSSLHRARENARAMRAEITSEMWESINATWLEMRDLDYGRLQAMGHSVFFDWVKDRSHLFRGVTDGTMHRDDGLSFVQLGQYLERADATARILDVKYHVLLPTAQDVGGAVDFYQWAALLRSVSAYRSYRKVYRDAIAPGKVAELLILAPNLPRSLRYCFHRIDQVLTSLRDLYRRNYESTRLASEMHARLRFERTETIIATGLHEYLTDAIERNIALGHAIARDFMSPV